MSDVFTDDRGTIRDLVGQVDSITWISTNKGAVRGNHVHNETTQWTYVTTGRLLVVSGGEKRILTAGRMMVHEPGDPHAWKALEDSECLVFTRGPRSGEDYESDTVRLDEPLIS